MFKGADANVVRAVDFEAELRAWFGQCGFDEIEVGDAVDHLYQLLLESVTRRLSGRRLRRQLFEFAQDYVRSRWHRGLGGPTSMRELPAVPSPAPFWSGWHARRRARLATAERQCGAVLAISKRCYTIFYLYKGLGLSRSEVGMRLSISVSEVERELALAATANARAVWGALTTAGPTAAANRGSPAEGLPPRRGSH